MNTPESVSSVQLPVSSEAAETVTTAPDIDGQGASPIGPETQPDNEPQEELASWTLQEILLTTLLIIAVFYTVYFTRTLLFPITLAIILNLVFKPLILRMERWRIPNAAGATVILLALGGVVAVGMTALIQPANVWFARISQPGRWEQLEEKLKPVQEPLAEIEQASKKIEKIAQKQNESQPILVQEQQPRLGNLVNTTWGFLGGITMTIVLLFFLLAGGDEFLVKLVELMPNWRDKRRMVQLSREIQEKISTYLFTITLINALLGVCIGIGMWSIGLSNPALWGALGFLLNYIPFAGPAVGSCIVFVAGLSEFNSFGQAALAPAIYIGVNAVEANIVTPSMLSKSVSLNPVMIVLSLFFWGWLWGIGGVLLAVPLLVIFKIALDHTDSLAPLGRFLARGKTP